MINMINPIKMMSHDSIKEKFLQIYFEKVDPDKGIVLTLIQCKPSDKLADFIRKYRNKSGEKDENEKFIYNLHSLDPNLTIEEIGLKDSCRVKVIKSRSVYGG